MNATAEKFGYPVSLVKSFGHWHVLVRPAQPTLGSLVLICSDPTDHFGEHNDGNVIVGVFAGLLR